MTAPINSIADEITATLGSGHQIALFSSRPAGLTLDHVTRIAPVLRQRFEARGETIIGRKIGFTNRTIWPEYGVYEPIWGYMTDRTVYDLAATEVLRLSAFTEPRIEPEVIFAFARAPQPGMDDAALLDCIDWLAHGFEIVQSLYPNWKFTPADAAVANGLHGALLIGERHAVAPRKAEWLRELPDFEIDLLCDGTVADRGRASNVMEGPVSALRYLIDILSRDTINPQVKAGDIITTGTLTKALPVKPGETWSTAPRHVGFGGISVTFS